MIPRPEVPADLSSLSLDELNALIIALAEWAAANATGEGTPEQIAAMQAAATDHARLAARAAELAAEPAPEPTSPSPSLAELAAGITAPATPSPTPEPAAAIPPAPSPSGDAPAATFTAADLTTAVTAAVTAAIEANRPEPVQPTEAEGVTAGGDPVLPALSGLRSTRPTTPEVTPIRPESSLVASADIPGTPMGTELATMMDLGRAYIARREQIGVVSEGTPAERIIVATMAANWPEERLLVPGHDAENHRKIMEASPVLNALPAAGGPCVPAQPYYSLLVQSGAHRPVRDALLGFGVAADRGSVTVLQPPTISSPGSVARTVTDGVLNTTTTVTSATAAFVGAGWGDVGGDVGAAIAGTGIPAGAIIVQVVNATTVVISAAATATASGVTLTITRLGAIGQITGAQDTAALDGTLASQIAGMKPCLHVACPPPTTVELDIISWCLEFGNLTSRAFPEQMPAWLQLTLAVWARTAETRLLNRLSALSTQTTATGAVGAARSLPPQLIKVIAYLRNRNRLSDDVTIRVMMPSWVIDLAVCDLMRGSGYQAEFYSQARAQFTAAFAEVNAVVSYYADSATGKAQLFAPGSVQGAKQANGALVAFPSTVVSYVYPEGSFLFLGGDSLNFGMWRDSGLNARNNYRMMAETFENVAATGYEMIEHTATLVANGTFAGTAYGSSTVAAPVAIPTSF